MLTTFRALVRKDLRLFFSDRRAVMMSIVAPILIGSFFGYTLGGGSGKTETSRIPVLAIDQDGSSISRAIVARLAAEKALDVKPADLAKAREQVRKGKTTVGIVIPPKFGADAGRAFFANSPKPQMDILYDPSHTVELSMVQGILTGGVMQVVSKEMFAGQAGRDMVSQALEQVGPGDLRQLLLSVQRLNVQTSGAGGETAGLRVPFETRGEAITSSQGVRYNGYAHAFAGMGIQFILFVGIDVGINMLQQRQRGLWKRFRAAPLSKTMLLGSRAVSAAITSLFVLFVIFTFARVVFGVQIQGSRVGFWGVCAAFSLMTAAFGLLIAALGKTPEATRGLSVLITLLLVMLGGSWVPTFIFPQWLQKLTLAVPTRWAMDGLDAMTWRGLGFDAAAAPIGVLLLFAVVFGAVAVSRFRWEAE
jgi:ABC-2 type transport system permease protein